MGWSLARTLRCCTAAAAEPVLRYAITTASWRRTQASKAFEWKKVNAFLCEKGVTQISAGLDAVPMVY